MKNNKNPGSGVGRIPGKNRKGVDTFMPLTQIITKCRESKAYFRALIVRAIEDGIVFILAGAAIWTVCYVLGGILRGLGVA